MELVEKAPEAGRELDAEIGELFFGPMGRNEPKYFSTDIEDSIAVLYKLHDDGWFWRLDSVQGGFICTLQRLAEDPRKVKDPKRQTFQIGAKTLPLAICTAALKTRSK